MEAIRILFLESRDFDSGAAVRGGGLVTDEATEPFEFRCTSPVRPTQLQKTLWGGRLTDHIAAQLIGNPLVNALANAPTIILVRRPEFVELRGLVQCPLVQVLKNEELAKASPLTIDNQDDEILDGSGSRFEPVVLKVHRRHPGDLATARALLAQSAAAHNLLEPFERITIALDLIHDQESKKSGR